MAFEISPRKIGQSGKIQIHFYKLKEGDTYHKLTYRPTEEENDLGAVIDGKLVFEQISTLKLIKQVVLWQS